LHDTSFPPGFVSRSRKKTPIVGFTTAESEKAEKQANHRRERRRVRQVLAAEPEAEVLPHTRELSNPWLMGKDGKVYLAAGGDPGMLRK
jgi:hypothetical protein